MRMGDSRKEAETVWQLAIGMNRVFLIDGVEEVAGKTSKKRKRDVEYPLMSLAALRTVNSVDDSVVVTKDLVVID